MREPKKTVSIEVRVSDEDKTAFMAACNTAGKTASEALRDLMRLFVLGQETKHRALKLMKRYIFRPAQAALATAAAVAGLTASVVFVPAASADMSFSYAIALEDGDTIWTSNGDASLAGDQVFIERLGEDVSFELSARNCEVPEAAECEGPTLMLSVNVDRGGDVLNQLNGGLDFAGQRTSQFEWPMADGRKFYVIVTLTD
jgi:hypothetical protein